MRSFLLRTETKCDVIEAAALEWRRKAVNIFSLVSAIAYLPPLILMVAGQAPPNGWPVHLIVISGYSCFVFSVLLHRVDYRARAWMILSGGFVVALVHLVMVPHGPFGRALPAMLPIIALN